MTLAALPTPLVSPEQLIAALAAGATPLIVDCSFDLADVGAGERAYAQGHLPGAIYAHLDRELCGAKTGGNGRHPLPARADWAATLARLGVTPARAVVVYEGDNDLAEGSPKTPDMVASDFRKFVQAVHGALPDTWIYILAIKPSKLRWNQWPQMKAANKLMQEYAATQQRVQFIDIATPMFDANGNLPRDLFKSDGLHPTPKLYAMWTAIIKPILLQRFGPGKSSSRLIFSLPILSQEIRGSSL